MTSNFQTTEVISISGALILARKKFIDERGYFVEVFREDLGLPAFVQTNMSCSNKGVIRGMHFQTNNPQGKLVSCLEGSILDVIFDMRPESPTYKNSFAFRLDSALLRALYVPPGCAHGFLVLSNKSLVQYECTTYYDSESNSGFHWKSPEVYPHFEPYLIEPLVSEKDNALSTFESYLSCLR